MMSRLIWLGLAWLMCVFSVGIVALSGDVIVGGGAAIPFAAVALFAFQTASKRKQEQNREKREQELLELARK